MEKIIKIGILILIIIFGVITFKLKFSPKNISSQVSNNNSQYQYIPGSGLEYNLQDNTIIYCDGCVAWAWNVNRNANAQPVSITNDPIDPFVFIAHENNAPLYIARFWKVLINPDQDFKTQAKEWILNRYLVENVNLIPVSESVIPIVQFDNKNSNLEVLKLEASVIDLDKIPHTDSFIIPKTVEYFYVRDKNFADRFYFVSIIDAEAVPANTKLPIKIVEDEDRYIYSQKDFQKSQATPLNDSIYYYDKGSQALQTLILQTTKNSYGYAPHSLEFQIDKGSDSTSFKELPWYINRKLSLFANMDNELKLENSAISVQKDGYIITVETDMKSGTLINVPDKYAGANLQRFLIKIVDKSGYGDNIPYQYLFYGFQGYGHDEIIPICFDQDSESLYFTLNNYPQLKYYRVSEAMIGHRVSMLFLGTLEGTTFIGDKVNNVSNIPCYDKVYNHFVTD